MTTTHEALDSADSSTLDYAPLRLVTEKDLPTLKDLEEEVFLDLAYSMHLLRDFYNLFHATWHVADRDGDLAGYALVGLSPDNTDAWLLGLAVSSRHRGRGLGSKLMGRALASMMKYNVTNAYLTVRPGNDAARRIYHSFEFTQQGESQPDYYGNGEPRNVLHRSLATNPYEDPYKG